MVYAPKWIQSEGVNVTANQLHMIDFLCGLGRTYIQGLNIEIENQ